jgi:hypothetical protein
MNQFWAWSVRLKWHQPYRGLFPTSAFSGATMFGDYGRFDWQTACGQ